MNFIGKFLWYLVIGVLVSGLDILNERKRGSEAYRELIRSIDRFGGGFAMWFIFIISLFWPVTAAAAVMGRRRK